LGAENVKRGYQQLRTWESTWGTPLNLSLLLMKEEG
jgi:hypothetical protein